MKWFQGWFKLNDGDEVGVADGHLDFAGLTCSDPVRRFKYLDAPRKRTSHDLDAPRSSSP